MTRHASADPRRSRPTSGSRPDGTSRASGTTPGGSPRPAMSRCAQRCSWPPTSHERARQTVSAAQLRSQDCRGRSDANAPSWRSRANSRSCSMRCGPTAPCTAAARGRRSHDAVIAEVPTQALACRSSPCGRGPRKAASFCCATSASRKQGTQPDPTNACDTAGSTPRP
jgi:hypothetical protein